jgi:nicotinamidase-related amidase
MINMKVLIVVDMQKDFVDGSLGTKEAQAIVPLVAETIKQMADKNTVCIFTKDTHDDDYMDTQEGKNLPVLHCIRGTAGHSIVDEVFEAYSCKDYKDPWEVYPLAVTNPLRVEKPTFGSIELQDVLYTMDSMEPIEEITLMGLCTGICVMSNAILAKATLPEVPVNVVADCCACVTPESHKTALEAMKLCQINII